MVSESQALEHFLAQIADAVRLVEGLRPRGVVRRVGDGVAVVAGLHDVGFEELLAFDSGACGLAYDLRVGGFGAILLEGAPRVREGDGVVSLARLPDLPVGRETLGRIIDPLGLPLDDGPPLPPESRLPLFRPAPEIIQRRSVKQPLLTGVMAVDAAIPIGRGQRELIIGDRNVGKTSLAVDFVAAQQAGDVACVYAVIGQPMSRVLSLRDTFERAGCLANTVILAAHASASPGMQYLAPYAAASVAEWFRDQGQHALVVYDDLTKHADAYRELALLLDRPPGREAYPGDIFHVHAELLERAAPLSDALGGGSVTAFPLVETTDGDISSYIPTNLISITDGQIYLDSSRFERDLRPAIDIGRSVSRIGAVAQPAAMRLASKNLKIQLSRFESLEKLSRVGLDMDMTTQSVLQQGNLLRSLLRQPRLARRSVAYQVLALTAAAQGWLDGGALRQAAGAVESLLARAEHELPDLCSALNRGEVPEGDWMAELAALARPTR